MVENHGDEGSEESIDSSTGQCRAHHLPCEESNSKPLRRAWFTCGPGLSWILCMKTLSSVALFVTAGPRVEIYTELVCKEYYPDLIEIPIPGVLTQLSGATTAANTVLTSGGQESPIEVYLPADDPGIHSSHNLRASMHSSRHSEICKSDPRIQAEVARLAASMYPGLTLLASLTTVPSVAIAFIGGVLSCMTTGWWGGFLDRYGRARTMGLIVLGPFVNDVLTMLVFRFSDILPGKHWFLVIAPAIEGIMGFPSSTMAAETSYMRDVSEPQNLARNFSLLVGVFYAGVTIGPVLGGFLNERTGNVTSALYAAIVLHLVYIIIAWVALPESITKDAMLHARRRYADELAAAVDVNPLRRHVLILSKSFWDSFPLNVLAPKPSPNSQWKNWNLTWLAVSAGLINVILGSTSSLYQYALFTFRWSSLDLGYFISASGMSTVVFLMAFLPAILSASKRRAVVTMQPIEDTRRHALFDLHVVRVSSLVFAAAYAFMGLAPTGTIFTLCFILSTFGQGFLPAVQSVATFLHTDLSGENDTGRLFGALGVVYVLGGRVVGPTIYGAAYAVTVSSVPSAILWMSAGCSLTAFLLLAFIRLPDMNPDKQNAPLHVDPELEPLLGHE